MRPEIALAAWLGFVIWSFRLDGKVRGQGLGIAWVALLWMSIVGSKPISHWLNPHAPASGGWIDEVVFLFLMSCALWNLNRKRFPWGDFVSSNKALVAYFVFMLISIAWTVEPFAAFKNLVKMAGMPLIPLVLLTETNRADVFKSLIRRCAYLLLPLSWVLNKYFYNIAVSFNTWTGEIAFNGVASDKNGFGQLLWVLCLLIFAILVCERSASQIKGRLQNRQLAADLLTLAVGVFLLWRSDSKTSLICFALGAFFVLAGPWRYIRWRVATWMIIGAGIFFLLDSSFSVWESFTKAIGRDPSITNRAYIWQEVLSVRGNLWIGTGYEGFWVGERLNELHRGINIAHNGYLEVFLTLGLVGLGLLVLIVVSGYRTCKDSLERDFNFGRIALPLFASILVYNLTDSGFKGMSFSLFFFYLLAIKIPAQFQSINHEASSLDPRDSDTGKSV